MPHSDRSTLLSKLQKAKEQVSIGDIYVHYKNPKKQYTVTDVRFDEATEGIRVDYEEFGVSDPLKWSRLLKGKGGWLTPVEKEGQKILRFQKVQRS